MLKPKFFWLFQIYNQFDTAKTQAVLQHDLVASIGRATIFRVIKKLEDRNKISKSQTNTAPTHSPYRHLKADFVAAKFLD